MTNKWLLSLVFAALPAFAALDVGKQAPPLDARLLDGTAYSLQSERGKVVIVNFWATWCAPCRAEMPAIDAYYRKHRGEGLEVIAVSMDDPGSEEKVRNVMRAFSFPAALGPQSDFKGYQRIWRLPLTFVVDRDGVLREKDWYGDPGIDQALLEKTVTPLLA
ncbi:MAG TPA: TlpA disulfide reductase family protein, partial [Usitatibacter sp.]|nr:TlpA disulfide reductase family protein [Usitatibacter sp.]